MKTHHFSGKWITDEAFAALEPVNVFHRQLEKITVPEDKNQNSHILFRRKFDLKRSAEKATVYITADDYYKLYINGNFVAQGPAPAYHNCYNYNEIDVTAYLSEGENCIAVHTYYQGLINRVWQSGDFRHGLLMDVVVDGETIVRSDESFLTHRHTAYSALGIVGYKTQFMERYDSHAHEVDFYAPDFDDSAWENARIKTVDDYTLVPQRTKLLTFETVKPVSVWQTGGRMLIDFGATYVGTVTAHAKGADGEKITLRMGQELNGDGSVRYALRCNCVYEEEWILSGGEDALNQFDYKAFRYMEIITEGDAEITDIALQVRHYPFALQAKLRAPFAGNESAERIWELCVHSQKYGVQETIQDCPDREKGFYLGDGCYDAFTHYVLTGDDSMVRKLIDDAFASSFICEGLMTCMSCSFMQEIAEYPLIMPDLMLWLYRAEGDLAYLRENVKKMRRVLDFYRENYEKDGIINNLDRWCVVEWPKNYQDGYAADVAEGKISTEAHIAINAYYYRAISVVNKLCEIVGEEKYRDEGYIYDAIVELFYDKEAHLFVDGEEHRHISLIGNAFPYAFDMAPDREFEANFRKMLREKGEDQTSFFTTFPLLLKFTREGDLEQVERYIMHEGTWRRMLREGATSTFEGWGKDCKWNTSLFHLTMSSAAMFMADVDLKGLLQ
ncbi:MAG: family 78 glycoside hydrolase catalytic domain [Clostridia bacterium]|nr:family 78 glycoside hydrolase catalytic domain [Clostridia bacterium]